MEDSGKELAERIRQIVEETGCGKANIIRSVTAARKSGLGSPTCFIVALYAAAIFSRAAWGTSGKELAARIRQLVEETGCEKVNIIAHSKGGLDSRAAIAHCGMAPYVATLTTINTPHRGCIFAVSSLGMRPQ